MGLNIGEAINLAPVEWLPWAFKAKEQYSLDKQVPTLALERILCGALELAWKNRGTNETGGWIAEDAEGIKKHFVTYHNTLSSRIDELASREKTKMTVDSPLIDHVGSSVGDVRCLNCHTFCYMAMATCACRNKSATCLRQECVTLLDECDRCDELEIHLHPLLAQWEKLATVTRIHGFKGTFLKSHSYTVFA